MKHGLVMVMVTAMLSYGVASATDVLTAKQYAEKYANTNGQRLLWNLSTDYAVQDVPADYTARDLTRVLFQASKLRKNVNGNLNDKLLAAIVCNQTTLVVEPLSQARKRIAHGCQAHDLEPNVLANTEPVGGAMPVVKGATVGGSCVDEGTLDNMLAVKPLICESGKWRQVVFKDAGNGTVEPLFYEGRCSLRFTGGDDTNGTLRLKYGQIADICLPVGWRAHLGASDNAIDWHLHYPSSMPNVVIVRPIAKQSIATLWIYPVTQDKAVPQKIEVLLQSVK